MQSLRGKFLNMRILPENGKIAFTYGKHEEIVPIEVALDQKYGLYITLGGKLLWETSQSAEIFGSRLLITLADWLER